MFIKAPHSCRMKLASPEEQTLNQCKDVTQSSSNTSYLLSDKNSAVTLFIKLLLSPPLSAFFCCFENSEGEGRKLWAKFSTGSGDEQQFSCEKRGLFPWLNSLWDETAISEKKTTRSTRRILLKTVIIIIILVLSSASSWATFFLVFSETKTFISSFGEGKVFFSFLRFFH